MIKYHATVSSLFEYVLMASRGPSRVITRRVLCKLFIIVAEIFSLRKSCLLKPLRYRLKLYIIFGFVCCEVSPDFCKVFSSAY